MTLNSVFCAIAGLVLATMAPAALAQVSGATTKPYKTVTGPRAIKESTLNQIPQIFETVSQERREHENEHTPPAIVSGEPNTLPVGGMMPVSRGSLQSKFAGIDGTGFFPPDCDFAISSSHAVNVVNLDMAFFDRNTGVKQFQTSFSNFFSSVGIQGGLSDPKVFYDKLSGRFFLCLIEFGSNFSKMLVAVSDDANPNGNWFKYRIEAKMVDGSNEWWLDYPGFGANKDGVVITGNMFPLTSGTGYGGSQFIVMKKQPLLTGLPTTTISYFREAAAGTVMPARTFDNNTDRVYMTSADSTSAITLYHVSAILTTPVVTKKTVTVPTWSSPNQNASSQGSGGLDSFEGRPFTSMYRADRLVMAHNARDTGGNRVMVRWYEFNTQPWVGVGSPTLRQSGNIRSSGSDDFHMPAISINKFNDITVLYTRSGPNTVADLVFSSRKVVDPNGAMGNPILIASSAPTSYNFFRWGDYFAVALDPVNDTTFWGYGMVANGNNWKTHWIKWNVTPPGGPIGTAVFPTALTLFQGASTSGSLVDVLTSNNLYYSIQSVPHFGLGQIAGYTMDFTLAQGAAQVERLDLKFEGSGASGSSAFVYLWNWNTGGYDEIKAFAMKTGDFPTAVSLTNVGLSKYINGAFGMKVLIRGVSPRRNGVVPPPYQFKTDLAHLEVFYVQP